MPRATYPIPQRRLYPWRRPAHTVIPGEAPLGSANWYVTTLGSDTNAGTTQATAFRTLAKAATAATTPGDVVAVGPGTYAPFNSTANGTIGARITYRSVYKWAAQIIGTGVLLTGQYTDLIDFDVSDPLQVGASNTLILVDGTGCRIFGCHVHDYPKISTLDSAGIDLEGWDGAGYGNNSLECHRCVIHGIGSGGPSSTGGHGLYVAVPDCIVTGNLVYGNTGDCITSWHAATRMICINNTCDGINATSNNGGILVGNGDQGGTTVGHTGAFILNNVISNNRRYAAVDSSDGAVAAGTTGAIVNTYRNNLIFNNNPLNDNGGNAILPYANGIVSGTLTSDPLYVGTPDYHLQSTSVNIDSGYPWNTNNPIIDLDDTVRPRGLAIDRGAYEFLKPDAELPYAISVARYAGATQ